MVNSIPTSRLVLNWVPRFNKLSMQTRLNNLFSKGQRWLVLSRSISF